MQNSKITPTEPLFTISDGPLLAANALARHNIAAQEITDAYAGMIKGAIEKALAKRVTEIEGNLPAADDFWLHGVREVSPNGIVMLRWKGEPVVEFKPAGYGVEGWEDAIVSEVRLIKN